jgi:hypothetical protein
MKKILLASALLISLLTNVFGENQVSLSFSKNSSGELILTVVGHISPIVISVGDNKITLHVEENKVNLTALGINELTDISVEKMDTASGREEEKVEENIDTAAGDVSSTSSIDTQIPPISPFINPNPPLTTPF